MHLSFVEKCFDLSHNMIIRLKSQCKNLQRISADVVKAGPPRPLWFPILRFQCFWHRSLQNPPDVAFLHSSSGVQWVTFFGSFLLSEVSLKFHQTALCFLFVSWGWSPCSQGPAEFSESVFLDERWWKTNGDFNDFRFTCGFPKCKLFAVKWYDRYDPLDQARSKET